MSLRFKDYTHAVSPNAAKHLRKAIKQLEKAGFEVLYGTSYRNSVPNNYRNTLGMKAPFYTFKDSKIRMVAGQLETRPFSKTIPAHVIVKGTKEDKDRVPKKMRVLRYLQSDGIDIIIPD